MTLPAPGSIARTRGAEAFLARVEVMARRGGYAAPGLNHWLVAACAHRFTTRTMVQGVDIAEVDAAARGALDRGEPGPDVAVAELLALAAESARARGDRSVREWHLVRAVVERAGLPRAPEIAVNDVPDFVAARPAAAAPGALPPARPRATPTATPAPGATPTPTATPAPGATPTPTATPDPPRERPRRRGAPDRPMPTPMLDECGTDLTAEAAAGRLGPVVGRDEELALVIEALCRPTKANPMLVGEPGVGKSALVEGLAQRIAAGDVPAPLAGRRVVTLDMGALLRESRYYGKLAERLAAIVAEARAVRAILFIDESHQMIAGGGPEGSGDIATYLKPDLARGDLSLIGATTDDEYRRIIAADGALERRFVVIRVQEPGREALLSILRAIRDAATRERALAIDDAALEHVLAIAAARLPHRREPDRSRDLLDQAIASALASGTTSVDRAVVEAAAGRLAGVPVVDGARLAAMEANLVASGLLAGDDSAALVERLGLTLSGLDLRSGRPRAVLLALIGEAAGADEALAAAIATGAFGGPERTITIDVGPITQPSHLSSLLGTSQGYVGYDGTLPIHDIAQKPFSVVRLQGIATCDPIVRRVVAKAIRDGYLTDGLGRRIRLSSSILLLEASASAGGRAPRPLGFGARVPAPPDRAAPAAALLGEALAAEVDLVLATPAPGGHAEPHAARLVRELAVRYRLAGVELAWDPDVERLLGDAGAGLATTRQRERHVEEALGRLVRPCLRNAARPLRVVVSVDASGLCADVERPKGAPAA